MPLETLLGALVVPLFVLMGVGIVLLVAKHFKNKS